MEQCTEKFAFVDTFMTGKSAPLVQRGMLCGKKQDIHEQVENPGPTHASFVEKKWRQWRNQYGQACRGDLLCGTRQKHGKENGGYGEQANVGVAAKLRKWERTISTEWVERKTLERDSVLERFDMDQNIQRQYFFTSVGRIHREVRHGYTNSDGLKNRRSTKVERNTKKTQFEVERHTPEAFLLLEMESADRGVQRIQ